MGIIIGDYAVIHSAGPRYTKDLDVLIGTNLANARKVFEALTEFGAPTGGVTPEDLCTLGNEVYPGGTMTLAAR
jgi:hypothetical protein